MNEFLFGFICGQLFLVVMFPFIMYVNCFTWNIKNIIVMYKVWFDNLFGEKDV